MVTHTWGTTHGGGLDCGQAGGLAGELTLTCASVRMRPDSRTVMVCGRGRGGGEQAPILAASAATSDRLNCWSRTGVRVRVATVMY